jgi:hypothetical protein
MPVPDVLHHSVHQLRDLLSVLAASVIVSESLRIVGGGQDVCGRSAKRGQQFSAFVVVHGDRV